jgi:lysozyme
MFGLNNPDCPVDYEKLEASVKLHEGLRLNLYQDTTGHWSIGYGRNLSNEGISAAEASCLLQSDLNRAISLAEGEDWWSHVRGNDARARAMCEIVFNMGVRGVRGFVFAVAALCNDDFETAAREFLNSAWAKQVGKRAETIAQMIRTGKDV